MISRRLTGHRCQCTGCGEFFNSVSAFDWHRVTPLSANGTPRLRSTRRYLTAEVSLRNGIKLKNRDAASRRFALNIASLLAKEILQRFYCDRPFAPIKGVRNEY